MDEDILEATGRIWIYNRHLFVNRSGFFWQDMVCFSGFGVSDESTTEGISHA